MRNIQHTTLSAQETTTTNTINSYEIDTLFKEIAAEIKWKTNDILDVNTEVSMQTKIEHLREEWDDSIAVDLLKRITSLSFSDKTKALAYA